MDEKQAIASSVLTMQSQTRGKAELTLRLLQASDTYTVLGDDSRFVVVSNDDAFDAVIGYADSPFDASANSSLAWYLRAASESMKADLQKGSAVTRALVIPSGDFKEAVEPLCKTLWAQDKPFNNLCPTLLKARLILRDAWLRLYRKLCIITSILLRERAAISIALPQPWEMVDC